MLRWLIYIGMLDASPDPRSIHVTDICMTLISKVFCKGTRAESSRLYFDKIYTSLCIFKIESQNKIFTVSKETILINLRDRTREI
jgi:hypothetical protein